MKNKIEQDLTAFGGNTERFNMPRDIYRVTAGGGGESLLIDGGTKAALYDTGMAYCHEGVIENIESALEKIGHKDLDIILLSHSHYDHIGALPNIIERWPNAVVYGAEKVRRVFQSDGAKATMRRLGEAARDKYLPPEKHDLEISTEGLRVDVILEDWMKIDCGNYVFTAIWTPGHTDCSYSFLMERAEELVQSADNKRIIFTSESVGVLENEHHLHTSILKSLDQTIESALKCKGTNPDMIICSHYGVVPDSVKDKYFDMYIDAANTEKDFILELYDRELPYEEIFDAYEKKYWNMSRVGAQPIEAFRENAGHTIHLIIRTYRDENYGE